MVLTYNISFLGAIFIIALFARIKRDSVTNVASTTEARRSQLGSEFDRCSFRIPEYSKPKDLNPIVQSAGQLYHFNKAVSVGMETVAERNKIHPLNYGDR